MSEATKWQLVVRLKTPTTPATEFVWLKAGSDWDALQNFINALTYVDSSPVGVEVLAIFAERVNHEADEDTEQKGAEGNGSERDTAAVAE